MSLQPSDEENSDNSNECVVCLSDLRDTLILPCRHLCLCNSCADTLRYQASNCPICRLREWGLPRSRGAENDRGSQPPTGFMAHWNLVVSLGSYYPQQLLGRVDGSDPPRSASRKLDFQNRWPGQVFTVKLELDRN